MAALALWLVNPPGVRADPPSVYVAEEIVLDEQRVEPATEVFLDTPAEREVIEREEIERRPGTTAADILRTVPGVRQQQRVQGERAAVSIEGMPPEFTRALVDGRRYAGEIGGVDDLSDLPVADAERVEILRGAQALRYGSDAAGGVVRVDTPRPPDGFRSRLEGGGGEDGWIYGAGSLGLGDDLVGGWVRYVDERRDGFDAPPGTDGVVVSAGDQSERVSRDVYSKIRLDPRDRLGLTTRLGWRHDEESKLVAATNDGDREERRWLAGQDIAWDLDERTRVSGVFDWYQVDLDSDVGRRVAIDEDEFALRMTVDHFLETGPLLHHLTLGVDASRPELDLEEDVPRFESEDPRLVAEPLTESLTLAGVYAMTQSELTESLKIEAGLRYQLHSDFTPRLLPQVAALWTPWRRDDGRELRVRVSWGRAYRTPSLRDLYQPPVPQLGGAYFLAGNPNLDPEHVESVRVGLEWTPHRDAAFAFTGFYNDIEDHIRSAVAGSIQIATEFIDPDLSPEEQALCDLFGDALALCRPVEAPINSPLFVKLNLDTVETRGVEARTRIRLPHNAHLELAYTYLDTNVRDSNVSLDELPNEPHHVVDAELGVELPVVATRVSAQARWRGRALTETSGTGLLSFGTAERSDPSLVIDLRLVQPLGRHLELYADLFNATNERIVDSYVVRGRTAFVGLRARFE